MKKNKISIATLFIIMILSVILNSCGKVNKQDNKLTSSLINSKSKHTGEELFKIVYFNYETPIDKKLDRFSISDKVLEKNINNLIKLIKIKRPQYFDDFKKEILSNNIDIVRNSLKNGAIIINENLEIILPNQVYTQKDTGLISNKIDKISNVDIDKLKQSLKER